jgi:hypothetical protein
VEAYLSDRPGLDPHRQAVHAAVRPQIHPARAVDEPGLVYICRLLAWLWAGTMAFMTIVSLIPPIVDGDATVRDADDTLSVSC